MKTLILTATFAALTFTLTTPVRAAGPTTEVSALDALVSGDIEKRKKKRIKGGSGCDDAMDVIEHPECR